MNPETTIFRPLLALTLASLLTSGCSNLLSSGEPARQDYLLMPYQVGAVDAGAEAALALSIKSVPGLDTDRILALGPDARLNHYANARWPDNLPEVLTSVMQRSLSASGQFAAVEASDNPAGDGWLVNLEVQQFFGIQDAAGETHSVRANMAGTLQCGGATSPLALSASVPVATQRLAAVVAAHQAALDSLTRQLLDQIETNCGEG